MSYTHIPVPLDCSRLTEAAPPHAERLASAFKAKVPLLPSYLWKSLGPPAHGLPEAPWPT